MNINQAHTQVKKEITKLKKQGVKLPPLPALSKFDTEWLEDRFDYYLEQSWEPEIVFVPHINRSDWDKLLKQYRPTENGLWVSSEYDDTIITMPSLDWSVQVIPGCNKPPITNVSWDGSERSEKLTGSVKENSPTLDEYLALQWTKLLKGENPVDGDWYWSFVDIPNYTGKYAPASYWDPGSGQVYVIRDDVGDSFDNIGVRLPVWGDSPESLAPSFVPLSFQEVTDYLLNKGHSINKQLVDDVLELLK